MSNYWQDRLIQSQNAITDLSIAQTERQITRYYQTTMRNVIRAFEDTYNHILLSVGEGREPTPADLYNLDRYWQLQGQMREALQRLGDRESALLSQQFTNQYLEIYNSFSLPTTPSFGFMDRQMANQMINSIWCADGMSWSQRVWGNTERLAGALNDELINCVVAGRKTTELKNLLQEQFGVSYNRANTLVRTEMAHIQTQAATQRYKDYGIQKYEILSDGGCDGCAEFNGKQFLLLEMKEGENAPPFHPNCRCCILPVIEGISD